MQRGSRIVGDHRVAVRSPLPRQPASLEMQPSRNLILVLKIGMAHPQYAPADPMKIA